MMQLIVYVTFAILPIITLLYFQIKFLPYHEVSITYWHRIAVILGFAMLILLIPIMQHVPPKRKWDIKVGPQEEAWEASGTQVVVVLILLPLVVGFSWLIATVPDEWIDRRLGFVAPASVRGGAEGEAKLLNPLVRRIVYDRLPNDDDKGWWRRWLLSYRVLIVEDTDLGADDDARVVLRERNFRFALLSRSDLQRADLDLGRSPRRANVEDPGQGQAQGRPASGRLSERGAASGRSVELGPASGRRSEQGPASGR